MPRYLTPERVCLLLLIKFYHHERQNNQPHCLDLLDFISSNVLNNDLEPQDLKKSLSITSLACTLGQWPSDLPGLTTYHAFLQPLWQLVSGVDTLHEWISDIRYCGVPDQPVQPAPDLMTPASPLGQFIRRCHVEFTRLQFRDSEALWQAFAAYREPSREDWASRFPHEAERESEEVVTNGIGVQQLHIRSSAAQEHASASAVDTDTLLTNAIHQLQKLGTRVPPDIRFKLEVWINEQQESSVQSMRFFMAFFDHWRAGQYTMALESLHRYFDYSLAARTGADNMKVYYQYALLHLSVLHADYECWEESVDAMNECIATARENQDTACLNFALSWLLYLRQAHPGRGAESYGTVTGISSSGSEHDEITFLKTKAREGKHWMLLSGTLLEEGRHELFNGGSINKAQEHVLQAQWLSVQHDLRSMAPAASLFYGSCVERLGQSHLSLKMYDLADAVHAKHCPLTDRVRSKCRIALIQAQSGHFVRALALLEELGPYTRGVLKSENRLKAVSALVHWRRSIHRGNQEASKYYLSQLRPLKNTSMDPEILHEIDNLEIESLLSAKSYLEAHTKISSRLANLKASRSTDIAQRLHWLILKARVFAASGKAAKGFSLTLRATATAERHLLIPILLEGLALLSKVLISLSEFTTARDILASALPHALELNNVHLVARMYTAMGEACVGFAGHACAAGSKDREKSMRRAAELIETGRLAYEKCEDRQGQLDCLIMKERIAGWCGDDVAVKMAEDMYVEVFEREIA